MRVFPQSVEKVSASRITNRLPYTYAEFTSSEPHASLCTRSQLEFDCGSRRAMRCTPLSMRLYRNVTPAERSLMLSPYDCGARGPNQLYSYTVPTPSVYELCSPALPGLPLSWM